MSTLDDGAMTHHDPLYRRHRFPAEVIAHAVWLYFRFPLSLRMVEDMLAAQGIIVSHQTVPLWAEKFGRAFASEIRRRSAGRLGDKWHFDEAVVLIRGKKHSYDHCRALGRVLKRRPLCRPRVRFVTFEMGQSAGSTRRLLKLLSWGWLPNGEYLDLAADIG